MLLPNGTRLTKNKAKIDIFPLKKVFTISRGSRTAAEVVTVKLTKNNIFGFGECVPYKRYNETVDSVLKQINELEPIENRVVAYSRISEDRWDIVLDRSQRISLPSEKPELAVSQFLILNQSENILDKKIERIDFRNKQRLTLTLRDNQINN